MCGYTSKHRGPCACNCHGEAWAEARPGFRESVQLALPLEWS